jgi:hypothetical protein
LYGAEIWQIPTRKINNILSTEIDVQENQQEYKGWKE